MGEQLARRNMLNIHMAQTVRRDGAKRPRLSGQALGFSFCLGIVKKVVARRLSLLESNVIQRTIPGSEDRFASSFPVFTCNVRYVVS
jgi:hypothetical protein